MLLSRNERFLNEYNQFKTKIERIKNETVKQDLMSLLEKLVLEVRLVDQMHENLVITKRIVSDNENKRETILGIRKKISQKLSECEKAGLL